MRIDSPASADRRTIAYVLKSFPRVSETFISSEVYRLEQRGVGLRLFVIKRPTDPFEHAIVSSIRAPRVHLPRAGAISDVPVAAWLRAYGGGFLTPLRRVLARHPLGTLLAAAQACAHAVRARTGLTRLRKSALKEFLQAAALADAIAEAGDVGHIHAHFCHSATTVAWLASLITGLPLSFTAHAKDVYAPELNPAGLLERKLAAARFVVTCTDAGRAFLQARTRTPVHCLYHGLDVEFARLCGLTGRTAQAGGPIRVLAVGRLVQKKGFDLLLEACAQLRARGFEVQATIIGEAGDHERALRQLVETLGLRDQVTFTGALPQSALARAYADASVFCLPCRVLPNGDRDGIPNVAAEAMAFGLPVVTTSVSGIPELIEHGATGLIVPPEDAEAVAAALARLHQDPALARQIGEAARARIGTRFDGDASVAVLSSLLTGLAT